jgi:integrase/recombinase XerC
MAWVEKRGLEPGPLFWRLDPACPGGGRLTERSTHRNVTRLAKRAGLERPVSPHKLRHHAISAVLARNGGNLAKGQEFSRHSDPKMLMVYLDHLTDGAGEMASLIAEDDEGRPVNGTPTRGR